jgi:uncharacterized protein YmfQ (DUF2313 family)
MSCSNAAPSLDICPTTDEMRPQVFALLPRGRAWQTHDGGPWPGTMLYGFWSAVASMRAYFNKRMCDMREEFFCATTVEMVDVWMKQYGLPDNCDPFPDLCSKVGALGSQRCEYFRSVAARRGWTIDCVNLADACGSRFGKARFSRNNPAYTSHLPRFGRMRFGQKLGCDALPARSGRAKFGARAASCLYIRVFTRASAAYVAPTSLAPRFGRMRFGHRLGCAENTISSLQCLIERIAPAHACIEYEVI